jgi:hypothetical protein
MRGIAEKRLTKRRDDAMIKRARLILTSDLNP